MNSDGFPAATSRWVREGNASAAPVEAAERAVLREVLDAMRRVRHGSVSLSLQDGRVVQIDVTEKKRL
jgi:hypothetical protein